MKKCFFLLVFFFLIFPFEVLGAELIPNSKSGVLIEVNSGKIIFEKDKDLQLSIASLTKIASLIIIFEELDSGKIHYDDVVTASRNASEFGGSQIYLEAGEKMTVRDLIKGITVASGNDAVVAMAEYISGSEDKFVNRMNSLVKRLKLKNTNFVNCTGLDEKNHYSSAYDVAILSRELITKYPEVLEFSSIYEDYLRNNTDNKFWLVNTNKLIHLYSGCDGLKTGHTDDAGYCLASTAKREGLRLIGIVLGENDSKVRNKETMELLDYGFNNVKMNCILKKGEVVDKISIDKTKKKIYDVVLKNNLCVIEDKDNLYKYNYKNNITYKTLPIKKGDIIGNLEVYYKNNVIAREEITVKEDINKMKVLSFILENVYNLFFGLF